MTCPKNSNGQSLCQIVAHPDHPEETFCITCNHRLVSQETNHARDLSPSQSPGFWPLLAGVYVVVFVLAMMSNEPSSIPQTPSTLSPAAVGQAI